MAAKSKNVILRSISPNIEKKNCKEAVCSCLSTFVSSFFVIPVKLACQIYQKHSPLYEHYTDKNNKKNSSDELYIVHCVHIPSIFTSCQYWPIEGKTGYFKNVWHCDFWNIPPTLWSEQKMLKMHECIFQNSNYNSLSTIQKFSFQVEFRDSNVKVLRFVIQAHSP